MASATADSLPDGIFSILDTDLYKLTMQCAIQKYFPQIRVTYAFTNRTPLKRLNLEAFKWLKEQVAKLSSLALSDEEQVYLQEKCPFLSSAYLDFLKTFRLRPSEHVDLQFDTSVVEEPGYGDVHIKVDGLWIDTILYEIPLLALTSEAFFRFCDTKWDYAGQEEAAYSKGTALLASGIVFSEFGTRRRRDYKTQDLVMKGLVKATEQQGTGKFTGTSNVHFAMRYGVSPVGTVAHEWFMGIAAATDDYETASEKALEYWMGCYGEGVLGIALTDTFGTPAFLRAFSKPVVNGSSGRSYAEVFTGVRQDSGDPEEYIKLMREYYDKIGVKDKTIVFSDSLTVDKCRKYAKLAASYGFKPSFGIGTHLTNDFVNKSSGEKSKPLNIVIKLSSANGQPAIKLSDEMGKNTGDAATVLRAKKMLGYQDRHWKEADESSRW